MATYIALVTGVIGGDTIEVRYGEFAITIRLANLDTSEKGTPDASVATGYLRSLVGDQLIKIVEKGTDKYGRTLAWVWRVSDNLPVNRSIVDAGHSRWID